MVQTQFKRTIPRPKFVGCLKSRLKTRAQDTVFGQFYWFIHGGFLTSFCQYHTSGFANSKGTVSRDFRPSVFSSNNTPLAPDSRARVFLNSASNSSRYDRFSNAKIVHAVSMTRPHEHFSLGSPFKFIYFFRVG
jgi:hypothetical protein